MVAERDVKLPAAVDTIQAVEACPVQEDEAGSAFVRQALWDEMTGDERVFMLGQDIGTYGGAFRVTAGFLDHFCHAAHRRHPDQRVGDDRLRHRRPNDGAAPRGRDAVHRLHLLRLQPDHQLRRPLPLPLGAAGADRGARPGGRQRPRLGVSQPEPGVVLPAHAGAEDRAPAPADRSGRRRAPSPA